MTTREERNSARRWYQEYEKKERKWRRVQREPAMLGDTIRVFPMFGGFDDDATPPRWDTRVWVSEGGWNGRRWLTTDELWRALDRWVRAAYATAPKSSSPGWVEHQCGGCRYFSAFDSDYGLCCNLKSPNDGKVTFEHAGCSQHSEIEEQP